MIDQLLHALHAFADYLGSLGWAALGAAAGCHVAKIVARTRAWRNILAAAHPRVKAVLLYLQENGGSDTPPSDGAQRKAA